MAAAVLRGITWGHSRGITPLLALSQRYAELHPGVEIQWKKRTLQEFADYPIEILTKDYDLLIIDHPWVGCAAAEKCVLPLNRYLPADYLEDQQLQSVGQSHISYNYGQQQLALAIDAATPAASYRKDLLERNATALPQTWQHVIELAKKGRVALPAIPIDILMNFYSFCLVHGGLLFANPEEITCIETGLRAIESMKEVYSLLNTHLFNCNPIAVAELMSTTDDYWYCPLAYGYSNYSRTGYADNLLHYTDVVTVNGKRLQTTIGGTGLAVSAFSNHTDIAVDFTRWAVSAQCQRTFYVQHGGQPGHRTAWTDETANMLTNNFFRNVLPVMDNGYMRPRYNGYLYFQDHAGIPLQQCLLGNSSAAQALQQINSIYRHSRQKEKAMISL